jgi:photosystem II stability/assembly factor-like uncharacterized protein
MMTQDGFGVAVGYGVILYTSDSGATWTALDNVTDNGLASVSEAGWRIGTIVGDGGTILQVRSAAK